MRLILHVGAHKTGTTSIQKFLRKNELTLKKHNIIYPNFDIIGKPKKYAHHELSHAIASKSNILTYANAKSFINKCHELYSDKTVIISAEPFYRHFISQSDSFNIWRAKETYIKRVADLFGEDIEITFVFRRQDSFAASLYQENVKVNRYSKSFDNFIIDFSYYFNYYRNVKLWSKYFKKINVYTFEELLIENNLEINFLKKLGLSISDNLISAEKENRSFHPDMVEFKRILNGSPLSLSTLSKIKDMMIDYNNRNYVKTDSFWLDPEQRAKFIEKFDSNNRKLRIEYGDGQINSLFNNNFNVTVPKYNGLDEDKFILLLEEFILKKE